MWKKTKHQGLFNRSHTTSATANSEGHTFLRSGSNQDDTTAIPSETTSSESVPPPSTPDVPPTPSTSNAHLSAIIPPPRPTSILEEANDSGGHEFVYSPC